MVVSGMKQRLAQAKRLSAMLSRLPRRRPGAARRIILHVGPHRTGTTTIQHTLRKSAGRLPERVGAMTRDDEAQAELSRLIRNTNTRRGAVRRAAAVRDAASTVAGLCKAQTTIISDEDLLGALPTRRAGRGLYPHLEVLFPAMLEGMASTGAHVTVAWAPRFYPDWLESVYYRRHNLNPTTAFRPRRYRLAHGLPANWEIFTGRLLAVCEPVDLATLSFEDDVAAGVMGQGLFRLAGFSDEEIANLAHASPKNVAHRRTRRPK